LSSPLPTRQGLEQQRCLMALIQHSSLSMRFERSEQPRTSERSTASNALGTPMILRAVEPSQLTLCWAIQNHCCAAMTASTPHMVQAAIYELSRAQYVHVKCARQASCAVNVCMAPSLDEESARPFAHVRRLFTTVIFTFYREHRA
jgi:hypothetical protein